MEEQKVSTFAEFHGVIEGMDDGRNTIFRGLGRDDYDLTTAIGRITPFGGHSRANAEKLMLRRFKESALPFVNRVPDNDLQWLTVAQHHGLPTRLMDWAYNPLVALFFAVEQDHDCDALIYVYWGGGRPGAADFEKPLEVTKVVKITPPHLTRRVAAQAGLFTLHPAPEVPFEDEYMLRVRVASEARRPIKRTLHKYGVSRRHLFPGLDGLAQDLKWLGTADH